jgi:ABC-type transport system involved in cytochrome bd biosynthesis fused ATPase/permease subunit
MIKRTLVQQILEDYNPSVLASLNGGLGFLMCGKLCAVVGVGVSLVDSLFKSYEIFGFRHLTSAFIGGASTYHFYNKGFQESRIVYSALTSVASVAISTGLVKEHPVSFELAENVIIGSQLYGTWGAALGSVATAVDYFADQYNYTSSARSNLALKGAAIGKFIVPLSGKLTSIALDYLGVNFLKSFYGNIPHVNNLFFQVIGATAMGYLGRNTDNQLKIAYEFGNSIYKSIAKFTDKNYSRDLVESEMIFSSTLSVISHAFLVAIYKDLQNIRTSLEYLRPSSISEHCTKNFVKSISKFTMSLVLYSSSEFIKKTISDSCKQNLYSHALSILRNSLFEDENLMKLVQKNYDANSKPELLIDQSQRDLKTVISDGLDNLDKTISGMLKGLLSFLVVSSLSQFDFIVLSELYNLLINFLVEQNSDSKNKANKEIDQKIADLSKIQKDIMRNLKEMTLTGGGEFLNDKLNEIDTSVLELQQEIESKNNNIHFLNNIKTWGSYVKSYILIFAKIANGILEQESKIVLLQSTSDVESMLSWSYNNLAQINSFSLSSLRLESLYNGLTEDAETLNKIKYHKVKEQNQSLICKNVTISYNQKTILSKPFLKFDPGKTYALIGPSGSGKSSIMIKVMGINFDGLESTGEIISPENKSFFFVTQNDYMPVESTLLELAHFPKLMSQNISTREYLTEKVVNFMEELQIDHTFNLLENLEEKKDWGTILSGGQKKKIALIRALLQEPDILILDESFNGLDPSSILLVQQVLKKHLPSSTIIVIDHHANNNNHENFYDEVIDITKNAQNSQEVLEPKEQAQEHEIEIDIVGDVAVIL